LTRIWFALTPAVAWSQCAIAFETLGQAFRFSERIAKGGEWTKRLVTVFEWRIPSFFSPIQHAVAEGKALVVLMIAASQLAELEAEAAAEDGQVTFSGPYSGPRTQPLLSDYTWNHTTLWAIRADAKWTYIQAGFSPTDCWRQVQLLRERYGQKILFHFEFMKNGEGVIVPGAIPLIYFDDEAAINEVIAYCRSIDVFIANPHVNYLEDAGRFRADNIQLQAKRRYDPQGLLNPGKMMSFRAEAEER
jgi:FAD/FMN-containing dehydrogenase